MAQDWSAMVNTTTSQYMKGAEDVTLRSHALLAMMQRRGNIYRNASGLNLVKAVKFSLPETMVYTGGMLEFQPSDKYRQLVLEWIGYKVTDSMTEKETLQNRGVEALIRRYDMVAKDMRQSLEDTFALKLYSDGTTNRDELWGLETPCGYGTTTVYDKVAKPEGSYAGRSTALGAEGGAWSSNLSVPPNAAVGTDWPLGSGDPEYDYLAPKLLNWSSTAWVGSGSNSWLDTCERVIRFGIIACTLSGGEAGRPTLCILSAEMYNDYLNKQSAKQTIIVPHREAQDLGFNGVHQEGAFITTEFGVPANTGYLLNPDKTELHCLHPNLFAVKGPEFDMHSCSWIFSAGFWGQMFFQPKYMAKMYNFASE